MTSATLTYSFRAWRPLRVLRTILGICLVAVLTVFVIAFGGASWNFFFFLAVCAIFVTLLCVARPLSGKAHAGERESVLLGYLVIWVFLMVSEAIFIHNQTTQSAAKGNVGGSALYQAVSWILSLCALAFISCFRPGYLRRLFAGPLKWASIFAIVAMLSSLLSPKPLYSAALAFKLCVIVLTLNAMAEAIEDESGIYRLFTGLFWGTLIVVSADVLAPLLGPGAVFTPDGRFGAMIGLSGACGMLLLLSLLFLWLKKNPVFLLCAVYAVVVMMLAGTKAGIVASFVSLMMFFLFLKRPAQAIAVSFVFTGIFILCVAFTPLGKSLEKYTESGNAGTLTGRTNLWDATWPEIKSHAITGKGYRASRFLSAEVPGAFQEAGNMHNSFLEVLYNNGVLGLVPIVMVNLLIVANLRAVVIRPPNLQVRYYAAAALALYTHLLIWGLVATTFGGAPDNRFMTFFAILLISMFLRGQADKNYGKTIHGKYVS
jgi:O-antigen ligase